MKKLIIIGIVIAFIAVPSYLVILVLSVHGKIIENGHRYEPTSATSHDNKYILQTIRTENESGVYAHFSIHMNSTGEKIYECPDNFRTFDLKDIDWSYNSYSVIVESGDVGTKIYDLVDDNWVKRKYDENDLSFTKYSETTGESYYEETISGYKASFCSIDEIEVEEVERWLSSLNTRGKYYQYIFADPDSWDMFLYYASADKKINTSNLKFSIMDDSTVKIYTESIEMETSSIEDYILIHIQAPRSGNWPSNSELYVDDNLIKLEGMALNP